MNRRSFFARTAALRVLALAALSALSAATTSGCLLQPELAQCQTATSCASCLAQQGCGWCVSLRELGSMGVVVPVGQCLQGGALGPGTTDGTDACVDGLWSFLVCTDARALPPRRGRCEDNVECDECSGRTGCGWCAASRRCLPGSFAGPTPGEASCAGGWVVRSESCAASDCATRSTCGDCLLSMSAGRSECIWCQGSDGRGVCLGASSCPSGLTHIRGTCGDS